MHSNLPNFLDRRTLASLAAPDETHAVRVIARKISSPVAYRHRGKARTYLFEKDGIIQAHVLDVPVSVWMRDVPGGPYRANASISEDLAPTMNVPLTFQVIQWGEAKPAAPAAPPASATTIEELREIAKVLGAPPVMIEAIEHHAAGNANELAVILGRLNAPSPATHPEGEVEETPAEARARKMREGKAKKKAEREAAAAK
jgi:hypothetical protein